MSARTVSLGQCRFELLGDEQSFSGIGRVWIGQTQVRSGRLPISPFTQSFTAMELSGLRLAGVQESPKELRIELDATFAAMPTKVMTDHSIDPIHDTGDWSESAPAGAGRFTIVIKPATYKVRHWSFEGFTYSYEYAGDVPLYWLLDRASWELGGEAAGVTVYNQSACSDPVVTFEKDTFWTTEGELFFLDPASYFNRVMTHNLPRWASHQSFDFQCKGKQTLLGMFDHVDLIRTVMRRDAGKSEIKCFDKHIFDETSRYATSPKAILLNSDPKTVVDQQNCWTWVFDDVHRRARAESGLKEQPPVPMTAHHQWRNFHIDTYYKDIVPACASMGITAIFAENFKKNDATEITRLPKGNMCLTQDFVISERVGGTAKFKAYIDACREHGIKNYMWTGGHVSYSAEINGDHRAEGGKCWYIAMNDTRTKYGGAYTNVCSTLDWNNAEAREYFVKTHRQIMEETGLEGYYIDSFYNLWFMPVDFKTGHPKTIWRAGLEIMKQLQDAGCGWYIESFGPFGQPGHGHPASYNIQNSFISYYVGLGNGYVTVPVPGVTIKDNMQHEPGFLFFLYAQKVPASLRVFINNTRIDKFYGDEHRRVIREYTQLLDGMHTRFLQEDGQAVIWHNEQRTVAQVWSMVDRRVALPGTVVDVSSGTELPAAQAYDLKASHVYLVKASELPERI